MKSFTSKFLKYKIHHLLLWAVYYVGWIQVYKGYYENLSDLMLVTLVYGTAHASLYYSSQYVLIPRFWKKGQPLRFIMAFVGFLMGSVLFMYLAIRTILGDIFDQAFGGNHFPWLVFFALSNIFWVSVMLSIKMLIDNYRNQRANERKEKERLESELQYLKAQVNPHFLFNTINSVYVLIGQDPQKASETLIKLSDLLRAQLYDFSGERIPIEQEISYLENYIELEKLRKGKKLVFTFEKDENLINFNIAPLVLVPFLENCFKHISSFTDQNNIIKVTLGRENGSLVAAFFNTRDQYSGMPVQPGGIGLKNVRRRLELLYPNAHALSISDMPDSYKVTLSLKIDE
ncbi:MAG: sensor histidine kinase [Bacteroidota bacterium]